jgi:glutamyl-tRNA reductase
VLDRVFRQALGVGKRVRTETAIGESPASVSSAAAALAAQVFGDLGGRRVLLIGAGRIGELAAANLVSRGAEIAFVANRTVETARELAHRFGGEAISLDALPAKLADVDVVVSSTSAPDVVLHAGDVPAKHRTPLFFMDIAVPRDLDAGIGRLDGCFLYDIDDLEAVVADTLAGRRAEAERAEQLVEDEVERYRAWRASLDVVPAIASLRARAEEIRSAELAKLKGRVSDDERRTIESVTSQILNKLLHLPTVRMKEAAVSADGAAYADAVRHLFGLEDEK